MSGTMIIIEADDDGVEITTFEGVGRFLPRIGKGDLEPLLGSGITVERTLKTTSADAGDEVRAKIRTRLAAERDPREGD